MAHISIGELRPQILALTAEIARIEDEINRKVYALFDLTDDEIALLEANIESGVLKKVFVGRIARH